MPEHAPARVVVGRPGWNRGVKLPAEVLRAEEVGAILAATNRGLTGARTRALIALLYRGGLRLSEALALTPSDVNADAGAVRVRRGKGGKARTVSVDAGGLLLVERWLGHRGRLDVTARAPLLCSLDGSTWDARNARASIAYAARKAGIERRANPHAFRHSYAFELSQEGVPVAVLQKLLGHTSLATTSRYVDHLGAADVLAVGRSRPWAAVLAEGQP